MPNNYLLEGEDIVSTNLEIDKIINKCGFVDSYKSEYDLEESTLSQVLEELDTYGFFSDKKIVIVSGIENINQDENKKELEHLSRYLDNPNPDNLLIFKAFKLNNVLKLTKELKKKCEYKLISSDPKSFIKGKLDGYSVENGLEDYLINKCLGDISKLEKEIEKLKIFKIDDKKILKSDVDLLVVEKLGDSTDLTFAFNRALAEKNKKDAILKYQELLNYNLEPLSILGLIASQIRIIYQVKVLEKNRMSDIEIAKVLGEKNSYRVKKTRELTRYYTESELLELMKTLADIDLKIKTTDIDPNGMLELFILNI